MNDKSGICGDCRPFVDLNLFQIVRECLVTGLVIVLLSEDCSHNRLEIDSGKGFVPPQKIMGL